VKRVRKYLAEIDARASGKLDLLSGAGKDRARIQSMGKGAEERKSEEVIVKGTGKAIEKVLRVGLYFQGQGDVLVRLRTGSVGAVDDVLSGRGEEEDVGEGDGKRVEEGEDEVEVQETRVRMTSMLEVGIRLR
jgi:ribonuclease P/MRP protein subunit POP7